jgi:hypothetical protein
LTAPLSHGISDLAFDVTYIKTRPHRPGCRYVSDAIPQNEGSK